MWLTPDAVMLQWHHSFSFL